MRTKDLKEPIEVIKLIQTLLMDTIEEAINTENLDEYIEKKDKFDLWHKTIGRVYKILNSKLIELDVALIHLKIHDEEKYYKLRDYIIKLDKDIMEYHTLKASQYEYSELPPTILNEHLINLEKFHFTPKSNDFKQNESAENSQKEEIEVISEIELTRIKDKVAMLIELGIIDHLILKYPHIKGVALRLTKLLSPILDIEVNSLKKIINAFVTDAKKSTDYPKITVTVKNAVDKLTLEK
jgi:hypothetical protein